jgi:cytochrome P450
LPQLFAGLVGATLNEELRLVPAIVMIPKSTAPGSPQSLTVDGKQVTVPGGATVGLHSVAIHRDPKSWPYLTSSLSDENDSGKDLDTFRPERWFEEKPGPHLSFDQKSKIEVAKNATNVSSETAMSLDSSDTASSMFRPGKGSYVAFSEGARACVGRRFAQVEILAALAVILKSHSVELSVDEWATEAELDKMSIAEQRQVWQTAKKDMERKIKEEASSIVTLQLRKEPVKLRFVKRGAERFKFENDEEGSVIIGGYI